MTLARDPEDAIMAMVRRFYALGFDDDLLAPLFRAIPGLEEHIGIVADFWSHSVLGTSRYNRGTPYKHHTHLKLEPAHFERWMAAFELAVSEELPLDLAEKALKRARHMTESFKMGLLPLPTPKSPAVVK